MNLTLAVALVDPDALINLVALDAEGDLPPSDRRVVGLRNLFLDQAHESRDLGGIAPRLRVGLRMSAGLARSSRRSSDLLPSKTRDLVTVDDLFELRD